jgi:hypothetical protein
MDHQQDTKLKHEINIQEMHVKVKQRALEELLIDSKPSTPKTSMGLDKKKELATHNTVLKKQQKENYDAGAAFKEGPGEK